MARLTLTDDLVDLFRQITEVTDLVDINGELIGTFTPGAIFLEELRNMIDWDEIERRKKEEGGQPIQPLLRKFEAAETMGQNLIRDPSNPPHEPEMITETVAEPILLFTVETIFEMKDQGLAIFGHAPCVHQLVPRPNLCVELRLPDGKVNKATVLAVDSAFNVDLDRCALLSEEFTKNDVPKDTQVWVVPN